MAHIFGPVPSRRLGLSLGVDLVRPKTCSFDCIYCQLGPTTCKRVKRGTFVPEESVLEELADFLSKGGEADYITLSGSGEPTLSTSTGRILAELKRMTEIPTAVLTNSSLFSLKSVRREVAQADLVVPSLDAATENAFRAVNRPHPSVVLGSVIEGLEEFSRAFEGENWLEVMLVRGFNDGEDEIRALADAISPIDPDRIQLNTVVRPPAESYAKPISESRMREISRALSAEVVSEFRGRQPEKGGEVEERVAAMVSRRPCTLQDICSSTGLHANEVLKYLRHLLEAGRITQTESDGERYYVAGRGF